YEWFTYTELLASALEGSKNRGFRKQLFTGPVFGPRDKARLKIHSNYTSASVGVTDAELNSEFITPPKLQPSIDLRTQPNLADQEKVIKK
ncbi:MAG: hypothetical protein HC904_12505, partial [Blastochloris sp.]|nr:hypothetical protein [Blastochloris sp.]